jgi:hypothetical protein
MVEEGGLGIERVSGKMLQLVFSPYVQKGVGIEPHFEM